MKPFQKFIYLSISLFIIVGAWQLSIEKPFFKQFTLDVFGFLAITKFAVPALAYVYVYERLFAKVETNLTLKVNPKTDWMKMVLFQKQFFITSGLVFIISIITIFSVLYFGTHKTEYLEIFDPTKSPSYFMFIVIALDMHKSVGALPVLRLNETPIFYLKMFFFSILGVCILLLVSYAIANLFFHKKPNVGANQFIGDCVLYGIMAVAIAFLISFTINKIAFFRRSGVISIISTTAITFWAIKISSYPQDYFRNFTTENQLLLITFFLCLMIISITIGRSKRILKIKKLTSYFSKKEAEYLQLKNQINPHFLFNNLNVLVSFIELDPKKAIEFGHHLSNVYRHYLKNQTEDYVSLEGEINFITEYLSIYKAKFEKGFSFKMPEKIEINQYILPNCLQELIDNVFKHNIIAEEIPLEIAIFIEANTLVVQNTIHKKEMEMESNFGLQNIKKRYLLLTNNDIQIIETPTHFSVKIPILELQS